MPFSNSAGEGFDNRIAEILAKDLGADLTYVWLPNLRGATRERYIQAGTCDLVMGVMEGQRGFATSYAYYRTGYVFLYPRDASYEISSLNDEVLHQLRIGIPGGSRKLVPPSVALGNRGMVDNQVHFGDRRAEGEAFIPVVEAVGAGEVDVAVVWGPIAGHYAKSKGGMVVAPVQPEFDFPFLPMVASVAIGVRPGDEALRDSVNRSLSRTWDETRAVLAEAGVPTIDLPQPVERLGGG